MASANQRDREIEALRERLSRLSHASRRINESLDFDQVLQGVLDSARSLTGARHGVMTLIDHGGALQDFLSSGLSTEESEQLWLVPDGLRIFQSLTNISEPLRVPDLEAHILSMGFTGFNTPKTAWPVYRLLAAPMFHRGVLVGHVFVGDREDGQEFTKEDEETLVMFASQAALVIANAGAHREERQARADLETLVNTSPVGVVVFDARTGKPEYANREARRLVAVLLDEGQHSDDLLDLVTCVRGDGSELSLRELPLAEVLGTGETVRAEEITLKVPDGRSVKVLLNASPIHTEDGGVSSFVIILQDMAPLEEQERLRAEFLAMVSHELRMPLTSVMGAGTTLLNAAAELDAAEMQQFHRIIVDRAEHMRYLIGDLLDVARIESGALPVDPEPSDLHPLVEEAGVRFRNEDSRHPLEEDLADDLPYVMADRRRIVQVLGNLLSNAAGYSPGGSPITVTAVRDGVHVAVSVADLGRGIPADLLPELFRKFSRASGEATVSGIDGSGLGLAICRGIVEAHGGRIWAESDGLGLGARFTFTLPAVEQSGAPARDAGTSGRRRSPKVRVLAVDDNPHDLRYVRDVLTRAGYATIATVDPADVPRLIEQEKPHLVLLDLLLPGTDGIELMNDIRKTTDVPVVFLSVYGQDETVARALDMGAVDYLVKPFSPMELAARIRAALRKRLEPFQGEPSGPYDVGGLAIDYAARRVTVDGAPVELTATEYAVIYQLTVNAPRTLTHAVLLQRVWGPQKVGEPWLVRDMVRRLRRKLGDDAEDPRYILTEPRIGYRMGDGQSTWANFQSESSASAELGAGPAPDAEAGETDGNGGGL